MHLTQDTRLDAVGDVNAIKSFPEFFRKTTALLLFDLCFSGDVCHILHLLMESMTENWDLSPVSCQNIFFSLANKSQKLATLTKTNNHPFGLQLSEHRLTQRGQVPNWYKMAKLQDLKGLRGSSVNLCLLRICPKTSAYAYISYVNMCDNCVTYSTAGHLIKK